MSGLQTTLPRSLRYQFVMKYITIASHSSESIGLAARRTCGPTTASHPTWPTRRSEIPTGSSLIDYNSTSGRSVRIIGFSTIADDIITVIVVEDDEVEHGVNGWVANHKDRRIYRDASTDEAEGEADEQED